MENLEKINKQNVILFYSLFAGQIIFLLIAGYLLRTSGPQAPDMASSFQIILPLITLSGVFGSIFIYKFLLKKLDSDITDTEKLNKFRTAFIIKLALIESANLFSIIVYMLTGSNLALIISTCLMILFILNKPSVESLKEELQIKS